MICPNSNKDNKKLNQTFKPSEMRFCTSLLLTLLIFGNSCLTVSAQETKQPNIKNSFTEMHWIIERSPTDTVSKKFAEYLQKEKINSDFDIPDGEYYGESPYDDFNYKHVIKFTVKNEKVVKADYDEIHTDGHGKQNNTAYCRDMSVVGTTPFIAYPLYEKQLVDKQDFMDVDCVTGATYSLYRFRLAIIDAVRKQIK